MRHGVFVPSSDIAGGRLSPVGGGGTCPITCCSRRSAPWRGAAGLRYRRSHSASRDRGQRPSERGLPLRRAYEAQGVQAARAPASGRARQKRLVIIFEGRDTAGQSGGTTPLLQPFYTPPAPP